ncbi:MAG TPA: lipoate--protein ligase family protein [Candidatus Bathyarchaeota archaeon]|nr:lipoate--protein ligase family protein [Candidatus Bathyarchaeota archaeon]
MKIWRLLDLEFKDPYMNLAVEEAIPRAVGERKAPPTLRLWRNDKTVVIGCFQKAEQEVDLDTCREMGIKVVKRFTGGGAVYHDHGNLNYALSLPKDYLGVPQDYFEIYRHICGAVVLSLNNLGVPASFTPVNDITVNGMKISGTAASMRWGAIFLHGCLLVSTNLEILANVLKPPPQKFQHKAVKSVRKRVTNISEYLGRKVSMEEVKSFIINGFSEWFSIEFETGTLTQYEKELSKSLYSTKYSRDEWNLG